MSFLSEYGFEIKHIKVKENKVENTLIRHANLLLQATIMNQILNAEHSEKEYQNLKENITKNENN